MNIDTLANALIYRLGKETNMSYRKIGGLHHFRLWRIGFVWYWSKRHD